MKRFLASFVVLFSGVSFAEDVVLFTPPQVYAVDRYETGWSKNPFTLKTAPVVVEAASFSKDLAIGAYYGDANNPTVWLVNTKTHKRTKLKKGQPSANGIELTDVKFGSTRKDVSVEVRLGAETTKLHFDDSYLKQVAASEGAKAAVTPQQMQQQQQMRQPQPTAPIRIPLPIVPGQPAKISQNSFNVPNTPRSGPPGIPSVAQGGGFIGGGLPQARSATPAINVNASSNGVNLSVSSGTQTSSLVSQVGAQTAAQNIGAGASPVPVRRRLIAPVTNATGIPQ